jgi:hypothetical protein
LGVDAGVLALFGVPLIAGMRSAGVGRKAAVK